MLHLAHKVRGAAVRGLDGDIGTLDDFIFEPARWTVRYLVVDTGAWLARRRVLLSPMAVRGAWSRADIPLSVRREQVAQSPEVAVTALARAGESRMLQHYGHPPYWAGTNVWGMFDTPAALVGVPAEPEPVAGADLDLGAEPGAGAETDGLRSTEESTGYHIHATDGTIGHVDDFLIGESSWRIRYLLVDTSNWVGGKSVVVSTAVVRDVDRADGVLRVEESREGIRSSLSFDSILAEINPAETGPPFAFI